MHTICRYVRDRRTIHPHACPQVNNNGQHFGFGSRTCLGRHISILEMSKLIPQPVRRFDFELERPDKERTTEN